MIVPDEEVIAALLKDAKRFKSKWELRVTEPTRSTPNLKFLQRTLTSVVKTNKDRMRKSRSVELQELDIDRGEPSQNNEQLIKKKESPKRNSQASHSKRRSRRHSSSPVVQRKSRHCSKSKHKSPERRHKKSKKHKKKKSKDR